MSLLEHILDPLARWLEIVILLIGPSITSGPLRPGRASDASSSFITFSYLSLRIPRTVRHLTTAVACPPFRCGRRSEFESRDANSVPTGLGASFSTTPSTTPGTARSLGLNAEKLTRSDGPARGRTRRNRMDHAYSSRHRVTSCSPGKSSSSDTRTCTPPAAESSLTE